MSELRLRARSVSEIVDAAFVLYRRHAVQYMALCGLSIVPILLLQLALPGARPEPGVLPDLGATLIVNVASIAAYALMGGLVIRLGSRAYLGEEVDAAAALRDVLPKLPALIAAAFIRAIFIFFGILALIVGAFYVFARFYAVESAIVLEGKSATDAFGRSSELSKGRKRHVLNTVILVGIVYLILVIGVSVLVQAIGSAVLMVVLSSAATVIGYPLYGLTLMLLYYDSRIRLEGFDLERMAAALDTPKPATA